MHISVFVLSSAGKARNSSRVNSRGLSTRPSIRSRHVAPSTTGSKKFFETV